MTLLSAARKLLTNAKNSASMTIRIYWILGTYFISRYAHFWDVSFYPYELSMLLSIWTNLCIETLEKKNDLEFSIFIFSKSIRFSLIALELYDSSVTISTSDNRSTRNISSHYSSFSLLFSNFFFQIYASKMRIVINDRKEKDTFSSMIDIRQY